MIGLGNDKKHPVHFCPRKSKKLPWIIFFLLMHVQDPSELVIEYHRRAFGVLHLFKSKKAESEDWGELWLFRVPRPRHDLHLSWHIAWCIGVWYANPDSLIIIMRGDGQESAILTPARRIDVTAVLTCPKTYSSCCLDFKDDYAALDFWLGVDRYMVKE